MKLASLIVALFSVAAVHAQTGYSERGRSMVISTGGIAATEHPLASQAAAQILADGGNAIDAAIAANAVMGVVSPMQCGMGGDLFAIVYEAKTGEVHGLNASGWSPAALTPEVIRKAGFDRMPTNHIHTVTVPGAVAGWEALNKKFSRKKLSDLLAPAIHFAEDGFPVAEIIGGYWKNSTELKKLQAEASSAKVFLIDSQPPKVGDVFRLPEMAWSLRQIAKSGARAFYNGPIAQRIVDYSRGKGGVHTLEDFSKYRAQWVEPIAVDYRGWTVYEIPPNGQGIAALSMLNIMERFPLAEYGRNSANALHTMIEAKKLAYADMLAHVGDPNSRRLPVAEMLSKKHAEKRAAMIDAQKANCAAPATPSFEIGPDTTYLCVVDAEGNMVSLIQSIYHSFGSGLVAPGTGFALHNRGALFTLEKNHPNELAPRKRPIHTIIPAFMSKGETRIAFGIMGGWNQSQAHAQFVANVVDYNLNIQEALEAPRFSKNTFEGCDVNIESRVATNVIEELRARGHVATVTHPFLVATGSGQAVLRDFKSKVNYGASDPRKDGAAIPAPARR
jgi:gamma-glutamyltranspeptidase / glutathione hydrolase